MNVSRRARLELQRRRPHRSRKLLLESLEGRRVMAPVITGLVAAPATEGSAQVLTVNFTDSQLIDNPVLRVDWGDATPVQVIPLTPANTTAVPGGLQATVSRTYADDNPSGTASDSRNIRATLTDTSLITYYNFDEAGGGVAIDFTGNNPGALQGTVARVGGIVGTGSLQFTNAGGQSVNMGLAPSFTSVNGGFTAEALAVPNWTGAGGDYDEIYRRENALSLFSFQNDGNNPGAVIPVAPGPVLSFGAIVNGTYGELDMPLNVNLSAIPGGNPSSGTIYLNDPGISLGSNDVILNGSAHHFVANYNPATGEQAIYIDGVKRFAAVRGGPITVAGGDSPDVGSSNGGENWNGLLDEVAFYNRNLSDAAIADHAAQRLAGLNYFTKTTTATINNALPNFELGGPATVNEGSPFTLNGSFTDAGANDTFTATVNYGSGPVALALTPGRTFTLSNTFAQNGSFPVTVTINDDDLGSFSDTIIVNVQNVPPTFTPSAGVTIAEDSSASFTLGTFTDPGTADTHTVSVDWGDGSSSSATIVGNTITGSHVYNNPGPYTALVTVSDNGGGSDTEAVPVTVTNVKPVVDVVEAPLTPVVRNQPASFTFAITDQDQPNAPVRYDIDWDNDGDIDESFDRTAAGFTVEHAFGEAGDVEVSVVATEIGQANGVSDAEIIPITVSVFEYVDDGNDGTNLVIGGTHFADRITISLRYDAQILIRINNEVFAAEGPTGKIVVFGGTGGDRIVIGGNLFYDTELYGEGGNDYLAGGRFNDILDGGDGADRLLDVFGDNTYIGGAGNDNLSGGRFNDFLFGGDGNDVLTGQGGDDYADGGAGNDRIIGGQGHDILLGGLGSDIVRGDQGHDVLDGGGGNDVLHGGSGRDIMIGGLQADQMYGGVDDDLMVHSSVDLLNPPDDFAADIATYEEMRDIWLDALPLEERIALLEFYINSTTVEDDNVRDALYGEFDDEWYVTGENDVVSLRPNDIRTNV